MPGCCLARAALLALVAKLDRSHDRAEALSTARDIRTLLRQTDAVVAQPGDTDDLYEIVEGARDRVIRLFGTSAWDEPEKVAEGAALMGKLPADEPSPHDAVDTTVTSLTDRQLTDLREYFEDLPDMEPIDPRTREEVTSALVELQRVRIQMKRRGGA
jgi:hypothetical protein